MRKIIYILISIASFAGMVMILNISNQQGESYYYRSDDKEDKHYFDKEESEYIESFFMECSLLDNQVISIQKNSQRPHFVYNNEKCWIYPLSKDQYIIKKENLLYLASEKELQSFLSKLEGLKKRLDIQSLYCIKCCATIMTNISLFLFIYNPMFTFL